MKSKEEQEHQIRVQARKRHSWKFAFVVMPFSLALKIRGRHSKGGKRGAFMQGSSGAQSRRVENAEDAPRA